ncbi:MAG: molybdopterin oxidoreductase family protein, partial [Solirubrobacteraceae bacterium]
GVRRNGVKLAIASARPSTLDPNAQLSIRYAPGAEADFLSGLEWAFEHPGSGPTHDLAQLLRDGGEDVVILWGESLPADALETLLRIAETLGLAGREGAGLLEVPAGANSRGIREAGALPNAGPGYSEVEPGRSAAEIAQAAIAGEVTALYLLQVDPVRDLPGRAAWEQALARASVVVAHASVLTEGLAAHADVVFPAESSAEKEGTIVHPDGRLQRLRSAIKHPGQVRAGWQVLADIAEATSVEVGVLTAGMAFKQLVGAVPFYAGLTLEQIGGRGVRWPETDAATAMPVGAVPAMTTPANSKSPAESNGQLRVGTYRSIWASPEVEISPALQFTLAEQLVELSPQDAQRLGIEQGAAVQVAQNGTRLRGRAAIRTGVQVGTAFLAAGIAEDSANALTENLVEVIKA